MVVTLVLGAIFLAVVVALRVYLRSHPTGPGERLRSLTSLVAIAAFLVLLLLDVVDHRPLGAPIAGLVLIAVVSALVLIKDRRDRST
jgi:hypothetical protein